MAFGERAPSDGRAFRSISNARMHARKTGQDSFGVLLTLGLGTPPPPWYQGQRFTTAAERKRYYVRELEHVLGSLRNHSPSTSVTVFTDDDSLPLPVHVRRMRLDTAGLRESGEAIYALRHSPYDRSLLLDLDVTVCSDLAHTADFLSTFDAAFVIEPPVREKRERHGELARSGERVRRAPAHVPGCARRGPFRGCLTRVEANLGFLLLKRNARTAELLRLWAAQHARDGRSAQNALAKVLAQQSAVRFLPLPHEYNARLNGAHTPLATSREVTVLHARGLDCADVRRADGTPLDGPRVLDRLPGDRPRVGALDGPQLHAAMSAATKLATSDERRLEDNSTAIY